MLSKTSWEHLWYCGSTFQYFTQSESRQHWNDLESHWHDWLWCICILIYCFFVVLFYQHIKQCFVKLNFKMSVLIYHCSKAVLSLKLTWSFNTPFHVKATGKTCTLQVMIISHFPWGQLRYSPCIHSCRHELFGKQNGTEEKGGYIFDADISQRHSLHSAQVPVF